MSFAYDRALAPMLWVFVGLAGTELVVVHLVLTLWWPALGLTCSALSLAGIVWMVALIRSLPRLPVLVDDRRLVMRVGTLKRIETPLANVARLRQAWDAAALRDRRVLNLALIAYPNVVVDLIEPVRVGRRRLIGAVAHRLDDPGAFAAALGGLEADHGRS